MLERKDITFQELYTTFDAPIAALNCGDQCSPYNDRGIPFCCDTNHAVPTLYQEEWDYVSSETDLWEPWEADRPEETERLRKQTPQGQVLAACRGHLGCQRGYRSITCRSFPFYPYFSREGAFLGLSYYWEYEDRCWVLSNLGQVSLEYRAQFVRVYEVLFEKYPQERENFLYHSKIVRRIFGRKHRSIPLLHRNGNIYKVTPRNGRLRRIVADQLPRFGPYKIAAELPFPGE